MRTPAGPRPPHCPHAPAWCSAARAGPCMGAPLCPLRPAARGGRVLTALGAGRALETGGLCCGNRENSKGAAAAASFTPWGWPVGPETVRNVDISPSGLMVAAWELGTSRTNKHCSWMCGDRDRGWFVRGVHGQLGAGAAGSRHIQMACSQLQVEAHTTGCRKHHGCCMHMWSPGGLAGV